MTRRRWVIRVTVEPEHARLLVRGWRTLEIAESIGARALWLGSLRSWSVSLTYLPDLLVAFEHAGAKVIVAGPDLPVHHGGDLHVGDRDLHDEVLLEDPMLFGGEAS